MKQMGEVFCKVCGRSSIEDGKSFHKTQELCNKHFIQIKKYGKPQDTLNGSPYFGKFKNNCYVCGDKESSKYFHWSKEGEYYGKELCNKHFLQLKYHNCIIDNSSSQHLTRECWDEEQDKLLEDMYKDGESMEEISKAMNRTVASVSRRSEELKLGYKYMRSNNSNFKAVYQDYDWCYERYITKSMNYEEMAKEANATVRVIKKWCVEKHGLHRNTFKEEKHLSDIQTQLIMFGLLGDGHINKRTEQPIYIESHAENQKDYLYWKYNILKDICNKPPVYFEPKTDYVNGILSNIQAQYRFNTKIINDLIPIRAMSKIEILDKLNEFGLSIHILDDGHRSNSNWKICLAEYTQEEIEKYINVCNSYFGLDCHQVSDKRYVIFTSESSRKLDKIILRNIPNELDIIKYKITNNDICNPTEYIYVNIGDNRIGLSLYCRNNHLNYDNFKYVANKYSIKEISEEELINLVNKEIA